MARSVRAAASAAVALCYNVPARSGKGPPDAVLYAVLLAAYIALMCWLGTSPILMFFTAVLVVGVFFFALMTFHLNRSLKNFMEQCQRNTPSVLTLDDDGVELRTEGVRTVRMAWSHIAFMRVFERAMCFLSSDANGFIISVDRVHEDEILSYLQEKGCCRIIQ